MEDWQPISSAPKDGTPVDLWVEDKEPEKGRLYRGRRFANYKWDVILNCWRGCESNYARVIHDSKEPLFWKNITIPESRRRQRALEDRYFGMCAKAAVKNMFSKPLDLKPK